MLNLMTNRINIIIIILLTIKIISLKALQQQQQQQHTIINNKHLSNNAKLYGNFTVIEFLKELKLSKTTYDNILVMKNRNATVSNIFYAKVLHEKYNNGLMFASRKQQGSSVLREMATSMVNTTTFTNSLMDSLQVPVLQLNELQSFYLKHGHTEHLLSIVYIDISIEGIQMTFHDHKGLLENLSKNLLHIRTTKVIFLLNFPLVLSVDNNVVSSALIDEDVVQSILVQLFKYCWQQKIINVVALLADYQMSHKFYSYTHFPNFELEIKTIASNGDEQEEIYPYRLNNLKGYKLPAVINDITPRTISYKTKEGKEIIGGFIGHFAEVFAEHYNCTLELLPIDSPETIHAVDLIGFVMNRSAEISLGVVWLNEKYNVSYPIESIGYCIMLPIEANIPGYQFFTLVFKGDTYLFVIAAIVILSVVLSAALHLHGYQADLFDIICHENCLRGILSQSFIEISNPPKIIRFIYLKICILGILLPTTYNSYYSTYVTEPPKEPYLNTFDDVLNSGLKIAIWASEQKVLMNAFEEYRKYSPFLYTIESLTEFMKLRESFNTKYGYVTTSTKWAIFKEQQKIFTTPLFRYPENLCFLQQIIVAMPVQENSIFVSMVNQLILETTDSGLISHWTDFAFFEMVEAKKLLLKDLSIKKQFQAMAIDDLRYVLIFLAGMFTVATVVFLIELLVFHRRRLFKKK